MWMIGSLSARQAATSAAIFASAPGLLRGPQRESSIASCTSITISAASAGRRMGSDPARDQRPIVEIEHDARLVALAVAQREIGAGAVLRRDRAEPQGADVIALRQRRRCDDLAPGEDGVAGEERRDMPAAVDRRNMECVGEAIEAERPGERDDVAAVDEPPAEPPLALAQLVEMDLGRVLVKAGRDHVLGLLDGHPVDVVDSGAPLIVLEAEGRAAELDIEGGAIDGRTRRAEVGTATASGRSGTCASGAGAS